MPGKRINPNLIKTHFSYTANELATRLGVHKNTIRNWTRGGLPSLPGRPMLFHGGSVRAFLAASNASRKRPCPPGALYCFRCREARRPALGMVDYITGMGGAGNLSAICDACGAMMHRRSSRAALPVVMPGLRVTIREALPRLTGTEKGVTLAGRARRAQDGRGGNPARRPIPSELEPRREVTGGALFGSPRIACLREHEFRFGAACCFRKESRGDHPLTNPLTRVTGSPDALVLARPRAILTRGINLRRVQWRSVHYAMRLRLSQSWASRPARCWRPH
jgi:hypothetical protein